MKREILAIYYKYLLFDKRRRKMKEILSYNEESIKETIDIEEHAMPGFRKYKGFHSKYMLSRYLFALKFCDRGKILDTGCGFGWGAYLLADNRLSIVGVDRDRKVIEFARKHWKAPNLRFIEGSFLNVSNIFKDGRFDCVLGMETIEHLTFHDGKRYLQEIDSVLLKPGGTIILSSAFPDNEVDAEMICKENPYHLHIFTKNEIRNFLNQIGDYAVSFYNDALFIGKNVKTQVV